MKYLSVFACAAILSLGSSIPAAADVLFVNAPSTLHPHESIASVKNPTESFPYFDQFTLAAPSSITSLDWSFIIQNGNESPTGFDITIYDDVPTGNTYSNHPGALLYSTHIADVDDNENAPYATLFVLDPYHSYYIASFEASVAFHTPAAGTYWISIVADSPRLTEGYGWQHSDTCCLNQGRSYNEDFRAYFPDDDAAFGVNGTRDMVAPPTAVTPEPSGLLLIGSGALAMVGRLRKRLQKA